MTKVKKTILTLMLGVVLVLGVYNCVPPQTTDTNGSADARQERREAAMNRARFNLSNGRQYMIQQAWSDAIRNYKEIINLGLASEFVDPLFKDLAQCYMRLGMPDSSAYYIDQGLSYTATNKHLLQLAGYYKERANDYEGALNAYQKYNALYIDEVEYLTKEANMLNILGHYRDELDVWEHVLQIEPENNTAINSIISLLGEMGRDPKEFYQRAWENSRENAAKALTYINALFNDNDFSEAIRVARESLQYNPNNVSLVKKLAETYEYNNEPEKALELLEDYARRNPRDIAIQIEVTNKNLRFGNYEKAYNIITEAIKIAPQNRDAYAARGKVLESLAEMTTLEKGRIDCNDRIVYHMAYEDYQKSRELGNFNAQFRVRYLYDNDLTIAKAKERFLMSEANKINQSTYRALGANYSWITRTVTVE
jgi:tetratricopeptide (TPR) repeat protein